MAGHALSFLAVPFYGHLPAMATVNSDSICTTMTEFAAAAYVFPFIDSILMLFNLTGSVL
jgi:hypothetical protein